MPSVTKAEISTSSGVISLVTTLGILGRYDVLRCTVEVLVECCGAAEVFIIARGETERVAEIGSVVLVGAAESVIEEYSICAA